MPIPTTTADDRILLVVEREFPGEEDPDARRIAQAVAGRELLVVAPAGPVAGERWTVDLVAREQQARRRLASWTHALARHARAVKGETGDPSARLAVADAHAAYGPAVVIGTGRAAVREAPPRRALMRLPRCVPAGVATV